MTLSEELIWRGFINQTTLEDITGLDTMSITFYHGFDASADSQTIGNLAAMMFDQVFMRHGAKAILLAGGATSLIGDPGGKETERSLQSEEVIRSNVASAEAQLEKIFREQPFTLVNNLDWFKSMNVLDFMRDVGKNFGMSTLLQRDYIQKRVGDGGGGMSYTEFSYTLLQGYDFLHLNQEFGCNVQLAGSDQWGNALSGVDLVRKITGTEVHVLTLPLVINKATGKKFGKTEEGAIWLDEVKTSIYKFYQFWLNVDDEGAADYLKIYTLLSPNEIEELSHDSLSNPEARITQKRLAFEVTKIVHGEDKANIARQVTETLFGSGDVTNFSDLELEMLSKELPTTDEKQLVTALVATNIASSNGEARRLIASNAISVNGQKVTDDITLQDVSLIKKGKNGFALVR